MLVETTPWIPIVTGDPDSFGFRLNNGQDVYFHNSWLKNLNAIEELLWIMSK